MTDLDTDRPHITTAPHAVPYTAMFVGFCSCGAEVDRERDEARRLRREARREQRRSKAVHSGGKGRGVG